MPFADRPKPLLCTVNLIADKENAISLLQSVAERLGSAADSFADVFAIPLLKAVGPVLAVSGVAGIVFGEIIEMLQTVPAEEFATSAPLVVPEAVSIIPIFVALIIASVVTRAFTKSPGM